MANYTKYDGSTIEVDAQTKSVYLLWVKIIEDFAHFRNSGRFPFGLVVSIFIEETSLALM